MSRSHSFPECLLPYADNIIVLEEGDVVCRGSYEHILAIAPHIAATSRAPTKTSRDIVVEQEKQLQEESSNDPQELRPVQDDIYQLARRDGTWSVYKYYVEKAGLLVTICFIASLMGSMFLSSFSSKWFYLESSSG